jgi:hypothetical protein
MATFLVVDASTARTACWFASDMAQPFVMGAGLAWRCELRQRVLRDRSEVEPV